VGSYSTFPEATKQLKDIRSSGFEDAFIQTLEWYERAMKWSFWAWVQGISSGL